MMSRSLDKKKRKRSESITLVNHFLGTGKIFICVVVAVAAHQQQLNLPKTINLLGKNVYTQLPKPIRKWKK